MSIPICYAPELLDDLRIGAEIGALTQEGGSALAISRTSAA
jgi:hypothetical protein